MKKNERKDGKQKIGVHVCAPSIYKVRDSGKSKEEEDSMH